MTLNFSMQPLSDSVNFNSLGSETQEPSANWTLETAVGALTSSVSPSLLIAIHETIDAPSKPPKYYTLPLNVLPTLQSPSIHISRALGGAASTGPTGRVTITPSALISASDSSTST